MRFFTEQQKAMGNLLPVSALTFATIAAIDENENLLKLIIEPSGAESGWCHSLGCGIFPTTEAEKGKWIGVDVLAGIVWGSNGAEQYVVLGVID